MSIEVPPTAVIEAEIVKINTRLEDLGLEARLQGLKPINLELLSILEDELRPGLTPAAFWGHYIAGRVASVAGLPQDMSDIIGPVQRRLQVLTQRWMTHPIGGVDQLNLASSRAFLNAGFVFDWTEAPTLLGDLKNTVAELATQYSLREGKDFLRLYS